MKILIFDTFANIWPHSFPLKLIGESFKENGHDVFFVRCNGLLGKHCVAMSETGTTYNSTKLQKALVCRACKQRSHLLDSTEASQSNLDQFIEKKDLLEAKQISSEATSTNWYDINFRNIDVGKIASYEFFLTHKINSMAIPGALMDEYKSELENVILTVSASERILDELKPDRILVYNSLYSVNHALTAVAALRGIKSFTLQGGPHNRHRANTLTCFRSPLDLITASRTEEATEWLSVPIIKDGYELAISHMASIMAGQGAFAYSFGKSEVATGTPPEILGFDSSRPTLLVLTSSEDEYFAAELQGAIPTDDKPVKVFKSQSEWLKWIVNFGNKNPAINVIIRIHPRLAPNKREQVESPYFKELKNLFRILPANVFINWPEDNLSLYDLVEYIDVGLNRRSSAGLELMTFGVPVVTAGNEGMYAYPDSLNLTASNSDEYAELINQTLGSERSIDVARMAFRWLTFLFVATAIKIKEPQTIKAYSTKRPKQNKNLIKLWKFATFIYLQILPKKMESKQMSQTFEIPSEVENLIDTVVDMQTGLHNVRTRDLFDQLTLDEETKLISNHLIARKF